MKELMFFTAVLAGTGVAIAAGSSASASEPVDWQARTCADAQSYLAHPTTGRLDTMVTDSVHLGKRWTAADIGMLYADTVSPHSKVRYVTLDRRDVASDVADHCTR